MYTYAYDSLSSIHAIKLNCHSMCSTEVAVLEHSPTSFPPVSSPATLIFNQFETLIEAEDELINRNLILGFRILSIPILMFLRCVIIRIRHLGHRPSIIINNSLDSSFSLRSSSRINIRGRS